MTDLKRWLDNKPSVEEHRDIPITNLHNLALEIKAGPTNEVTCAAHRYVIRGFHATTNPDRAEDDPEDSCVLLFQNGVVPEVGVNGITPEALLLVIRDRFLGFQSGKFACPENAEVLRGIDIALKGIESRTNERSDRGVEGTHES